MAKKVFKIALPGYDAQTDTNPDHFSLFVDQEVDYVLIKEKERGSKVVANNGSEEISHNLGYVPFVLAFMDNGNNSFTRVFGMDPSVVTGDAGFTINATTLTLANISGSSKRIFYHIFYDNVDGSDTDLSVNITGPFVAVAKIGKNAFSNNPNDHIFHSFFNTFKIIKEATSDATIPGSSSNYAVTVAHGLDFIPLVMAKCNKDGATSVFPEGGGNILSYGVKAGVSYDLQLTKIISDATNIKFYFTSTSGDKTVHIRYKCLETIL